MVDLDDVTPSQRTFWAAEKILSTKLIRGERQFLIQWAGTDERGEKWKPTWEHEGNCTEELVEAWEEIKCTFSCGAAHNWILDIEWEFSEEGEPQA